MHCYLNRFHDVQTVPFLTNLLQIIVVYRDGNEYVEMGSVSPRCISGSPLALIEYDSEGMHFEPRPPKAIISQGAVPEAIATDAGDPSVAGSANVKKADYDVFVVPGDGNCIFHAVNAGESSQMSVVINRCYYRITKKMYDLIITGSSSRVNRTTSF